MDDALGAVGDVGNNDLVLLIGSVAEEIALKHSMSTLEFCFQQLVVGIQQCLQLFGIRQAVGGDMQHHLIFLYFRSVVETEDIGIGISKFVVCESIVHFSC